MQWGVPEENIRMVYNAFVPPRMSSSKTDTRAVLGIPAETFQIISVGRLVPWKGFDALISAMTAIVREIPHARLSIIGSGPDEDALRKKIAQMHLEGAVSLVGGVPHEALLAYLRAGDLFVLNSSYEGFSHTLLEALAMEISVMASDAGGNGEIITDGVTGRLYRRRDALSLAEEITRLYHDASLRGRFAHAGKITLEKFTTESLLASTADTLFAL